MGYTLRHSAVGNPTPMEEILRFVSLAQTDRFTITDLCEQFHISRKTAYKHLERYAEGGWAALAPRSHRPHGCPQRTDGQIEALLLAERRLHRTWGPKKLQEVLERKHGVARPPACSTIGEILRRHGLSVPRRRRPGVYPAPNEELTVPNQPNQVWTVDFSYPERFAQLALGHNSKAVHRAYARKAQVTLPPLEDYEKGATTTPVILLSTTA